MKWKTRAELHRRRVDGHNSCVTPHTPRVSRHVLDGNATIVEITRLSEGVHTHLGVEAFCDVTRCLLFARYCEMVKHKRYVLFKEIEVSDHSFFKRIVKPSTLWNKSVSGESAPSITVGKLGRGRPCHSMSERASGLIKPLGRLTACLFDLSLN